MTIGQRLREERERLGFTQPVLAELAGTTKKSQIDYEKDLTQPKASYLAIIADAGADINYIVTGKRETTHNSDLDSMFGVLPVYDVEVSAGDGSVAYGVTPLCYFAYRKDWLRHRGFYEKDLHVVVAKGDSMDPTICDGESLLVNTAEKVPKDGHIYVIRNGDTLWVKRIQKQIDGSLLLISDNSIYPPLQLNLDESCDIEVIGKVVNSSKNFY